MPHAKAGNEIAALAKGCEFGEPDGVKHNDAIRLLLNCQSVPSIKALYDQGYSLRFDYPFGDLLWPIVTLATQQVGAGLIEWRVETNDLTCHGIKVPQSATFALTHRVATIFARILHHEFSEFRGIGKTMIALLSTEETEESASYEMYCQRIISDKYQVLLTRYPVASRLLISETCRWLSSLSHFFQRFRNDGPDIQVAFSLASLPSLQELEMHISDPHGDGKSAIKILLVDGTMLVYKERPPAADQFFDGFIDLFHDLAQRSCLRKVGKLFRDKYQWCEHVSFLPSSDPVVVSDFYFSTGILTCVSYVLRISDVHFENIIAELGMPVLVDVETAGGFCFATNKSRSPQYLESSVLSTGIIPVETIAPDGSIQDFSALSSTSKRRRNTTKWWGIGTDHLGPRKVQVRIPGNNLPSELESHLPMNHGDSLSQGFEFAYRLLQQNREAVCNHLDSLDQPIESRILWAGTQSYYDLLDALMAPGNMVSEERWLSQMCEMLLQRSQPALRNRPQAVIDEEQLQLYHLDIPYFTISSLDEEQQDDYSLSAVVRKLCDEDCEFQCSLIRSSMTPSC